MRSVIALLALFLLVPATSLQSQDVGAFLEVGGGIGFSVKTPFDDEPTVPGPSAHFSVGAIISRQVRLGVELLGWVGSSRGEPMGCGNLMPILIVRPNEKPAAHFKFGLGYGWVTGDYYDTPDPNKGVAAQLGAGVQVKAFSLGLALLTQNRERKIPDDIWVLVSVGLRMSFTGA
jgi:hypothetical protein